MTRYHRRRRTRLVSVGYDPKIPATRTYRRKLRLIFLRAGPLSFGGLATLNGHDSTRGLL